MTRRSSQTTTRTASLAVKAAMSCWVTRRRGATAAGARSRRGAAAVQQPSRSSGSRSRAAATVSRTRRMNPGWRKVNQRRRQLLTVM